MICKDLRFVDFNSLNNNPRQQNNEIDNKSDEDIDDLNLSDEIK